MSTTLSKVNAWAVVQKAHELEPFDDIFPSRWAAKEYMAETFEAEHEAKVVPVKVTVTLR